MNAPTRPDDDAAAGAPPFPYAGPPALRAPVLAALERVLDPEIGLSIVDIGLVYGVTIDGQHADVRITMTSAACPVADVIAGDIEQELGRVLPPGCELHIELCWEPMWEPRMMSAHAKQVMGW